MPRKYYLIKEDFSEDEIVIFCLQCNKKINRNFGVFHPDVKYANNKEGTKATRYSHCELCKGQAYVPLTPEEWRAFEKQAIKCDDEYFSYPLTVSDFCKTFSIADCFGSLVTKLRQRRMAARQIDDEEMKNCMICQGEEEPMVT